MGRPSRHNTVPAQAITDELRRWVVAQVQAGCSPETVLQAMRASGWADEVAIAALDSTLAQRQQHVGLPLPQGPVPVPEPDLHELRPTLQVAGREVQVLAELKLPRVVVFGGLLTHDECDALVALARQRLQPSETVDNSTGGSEVNAARTSEGMFFERGESELIAHIEARIAALVNWPTDHGEGLQVLRYPPGAQYKPHHDYFDPEQPGTPSILARGGQRVGTVVIYLNSPERGGATVFPDVGLDVAPVKGNAVFFSYGRAHPDTKTLHAGAPVLAGEKWVATKWLREGVFV